MPHCHLIQYNGLGLIFHKVTMIVAEAFVQAIMKLSTRYFLEFFKLCLVDRQHVVHNELDLSINHPGHKK